MVQRPCQTLYTHTFHKYKISRAFITNTYVCYKQTLKTFLQLLFAQTLISDPTDCLCLLSLSSSSSSSIYLRVIGSILHGVDPLSYFSFQPVLHDWCNKGRGMCYPVCGMVHIKEPLLLIGKSSLCGDSGFPFSLSEWSLTMSDAIYP